MPAGQEDGVGCGQEQGPGVLDRGSGLRFWTFSASNLLRSGATHQPDLWGLDVLIGKEGQARPHDTGVPFRTRKEKTYAQRPTDVSENEIFWAWRCKQWQLLMFLFLKACRIAP